MRSLPCPSPPALPPELISPRTASTNYVVCARAGGRATVIGMDALEVVWGGG